MFTDDQEIKIAEYDAKMTEADAKLAELKQQLLQRDTKLAESKAAMTETDAKIAELKQEPYLMLKRLAGEELASSFQKAIDANNIDDLKKLLFTCQAQMLFNPKVLYVLIMDKPEEIIKVILEHPDMLSSKLILAGTFIDKKNMNNDIFGSIAKYTKGLDHFKKCDYILNKKSIIEIAKLDSLDSISLLNKIYLNLEQPEDPLSEALIDCIQSQEITLFRTLLSVLSISSGYNIKDAHKYLYEGIQIGNIEIVKTLLLSGKCKLDQEAFNMAMKKGGEVKCFIDEHYSSKFSEAFLANEISLEHKEIDVMGGLEDHPIS